MKRLGFTVLDQTSKGIYVCFAEPNQNDGEAKTQSVIFLKRKDPNALGESPFENLLHAQ